jgi:DNA topoisomerase-2
MEELEPDIVALFSKRAYDMAGLSAGRVRVTLNGKRLDIKDFDDYVQLYLKNQEHRELPKIKEAKSDRWEVICSLSDGQFG